MRFGLLVAICALAVLPPLRAGSDRQEAGEASPCECKRLGLMGLGQIGQFRFEDAAATFQRAILAAEGEEHWERAAKYRNNLGGALLYQFRYSEALRHFLVAREAAQKLGASEVEATSWANLANMYTTLGAGAAAEQALEEALRLMPARSELVPRLMCQRVRIAARQGRLERALEVWGEALRAAQDGGDKQSERNLWDALAMIHMLRGDLAGAETALANAFRLVVLHKLPLRYVLCTRIGRLRLAQARPAEALAWIDRARAERSRASGPVIPWVLEQERAAVLAAANRTEEARQAYRQAWRLAVEWRQDVLPAQSADLAADVSMAELSERFASLSLATAQPGGGEAGIREAWAAVEQGRATGLRRRTLRRKTALKNLTPDYARLLSQLRRSVIEGRADRRAEIEGRLTEMEARAGVGSRTEMVAGAAGAGAMCRRVQSALDRDEALITFLVGEPRSWVWSLTRDGLDHAALPGRAELTKAIEQFRLSVLENRPDLDGRARSLYRTLFGGLPKEALERRHWSISQDDVLFQLPLAALRDTGTRGALYLSEARVLKIVPSALWILHRGRQARSERLLAVGDAIHNGADPRLRLAQPSYAPLSFWVMPWQTGHRAVLDTLELPTLAGSRREVESIKELWSKAGRPSSLLTGSEASQPGVESELHLSPAVVHFATHVVPAPEDHREFLIRLRTGEAADAAAVSAITPGTPFLTLSINSTGNREGIDAETLAGYESPGALVVLNGCSTGRGKVLPGAGLSGFTSAWLAAGARSVVASLWPVNDDGGEFFADFYRSILSGRAPAEALRTAQLSMMHSGSWRAEPRYWSAYLSIGKE